MKGVRAVLAFLLRQIPTVLVLGGLAAVFVWGASNEWRLPFTSPKEEKKPEEKPEEGDPALSVSEEGARNAGLEHAPAEERTVEEFVEAPATLDFDHDLYAQLAPRAAGMAWRVDRKVGEFVPKGGLLALVASPTAGTAKAEFLTASVQHSIRTKLLDRLHAAGDSVPERQVREAELSVREGKVRLVNATHALANLGLVVRPEALRGLGDDQLARKVRLLGLRREDLHGTSEDELPGDLLPLTAPFDGWVTRRDVVVGEAVGPAKPVFHFSDVRHLHVDMDVRLEDVGRLAVNQEVTFRTVTGQSAAGRLKRISPEVNARTRTVTAHAEVENSAGLLRPGTFGKAQVLVRRMPAALTVPDGALQWDGGSYRVFVQLDASTYDPRVALVEARSAGRTALRDARVLLAASLAGGFAGGPLPGLAGLPLSRRALREVRKGERVVTTGSHVLKSEMLKGRIGGE
jgi:cobalt-zinc-cadmium efflux system membrane fusion protein